LGVTEATHPDAVPFVQRTFRTLQAALSGLCVTRERRMVSKFWIGCLVAAAGFAASAGAALASPAMVTSDTPLFDDASYSAAYVDTLNEGDKVHVQQCSYRWCYVDFQGEEGWVRKSHLSFVPTYPRHPRYPDYPDYPPYGGPGVGVYVGPGGGMSFGFSSY